MSDLNARIAELAKKYRPLAVEMLKEVIRIPADHVARDPKCGLSNGEKERLTYLKAKIVEIGAVRDAKDVDFDGFGNLVWTVEDIDDGIASADKKVIYLDGHSDTVGALRGQWLEKIGGGIDCYDGLIDKTKVTHASLSPLIQGCGSSSLYVLKFRPQGKMSEQSSALLFEMIAKKTINAEKEFSRIKFTPLSKIIIEDAWRTFGILLYARSIEASELFNLIRTLRLCSIIESEAEKPPVSILKINRLIAECQNYSIISSEKCKNEDDIALSRAKAVKEILQKDCSEPLTREHKGVKDNND